MNITERTKLRVSGADLRPMATEIVTKEIAKGSNMKVFNILRGAGRKVKVLQDRDAANKQQLRVQIEGVKMKFSSIREKTKTGLPTGQSTVDYENSIQKLMKTLKKDPKNKGKSGNELRKLATLKLTGHKLKESVEKKTFWDFR